MKKLLLILLLLVCSVQAQFTCFAYPTLNEFFCNNIVSSDGAFTVLQTDTLSSPVLSKGQIGYDSTNRTVSIGMGGPGVVLQSGQELYSPLVYNNLTTTINNCTPVYAQPPVGINLTIDTASADSFSTSAQILGFTTHDCLPGEKCFVTRYGYVQNCNTNGLQAGRPLWLDTSGVFTQSQPLYPLSRIFLGSVITEDVTDGIIFVDIERLTRNDIAKSYSFTSTGIIAGTYWTSGYYDFATTSTTRTNAATTINYGIASKIRGAHVAIVPSGAGSVDAGQVGLRVLGVMDYEDGTIQQAGQYDTITTDITTLSVDNYYETPAKFSGEVTFELYVHSGSPASYSLTFNYGFAKYDDFQDRDYTITGFECTFQGNAASILDIALFKHSATGWTYAAS